MWDYSWLKCGHFGGAFYDLRRCVAEAAELGYNTLRIDAFPHYYANEQTFFPAQGAGRRFRTWGDVLDPLGWKVNVRQKVIELANLCREYHIWLALDTWASFEVLRPSLSEQGVIKAEKEEQICREWSSAWTRSLKLMREDGILERAVWVAPLNEVPLFLGSMMQSVKVSDPEKRHEGQTHFNADLPELDALFLKINSWLGEEMKEEILRDEGLLLAYSALGAENYASRVPEFYDVADIHFMPDVILTDQDKASLEKAGVGASKFSLHDKLDEFDLTIFSAAWNRALKNSYSSMLRLAHDYAYSAIQKTRFPSGKQLVPVLTEAYGPCNFPDHQEVNWDGYKDWNADAMRIFASYDYAGLTLSNHAEPLYSLWRDKDWHRKGNQYLLNSAEG